MTLNCLTCQGIPRTNSDKEGENLRLGLGKLERSSWTGNLGPPRPNINSNYEKMKTLRSASSLVPPKKVAKNKAPLRFHSSGSIGSFNDEEEEPKLVRSCGMRRDWSFEDLRQMAKAQVEIFARN